MSPLTGVWQIDLACVLVGVLALAAELVVCWPPSRDE